MAVSSTPKCCWVVLFSRPFTNMLYFIFSGTYAHQSQTLSQCLNRQTDYGKTEVGPWIQRLSRFSWWIHESSGTVIIIPCSAFSSVKKWKHAVERNSVHRWTTTIILLILSQLANTEEYIDGSCTGNLGEVLVRCNNVLYIRGVEEDDEEGEMRDWLLFVLNISSFNT